VVLHRHVKDIHAETAALAKAFVDLSNMQLIAQSSIEVSQKPFGEYAFTHVRVTRSWLVRVFVFSGTKEETLQALKLLQDEGKLNHTDMPNALLKVFPFCAARSQSDPGASAAGASAAGASAAGASAAGASAEVGGDDDDCASAAKKPKVSDDQPKVSLKI